MTDHSRSAKLVELRPLPSDEIEATSGGIIIDDFAGIVAKAVLPVMIDAVFPPAA